MNEVSEQTQQPLTMYQGDSPSWRISAVVWNGEGWAPPCGITLDTPHDDEDKQRYYTGSVVARQKSTPSAGHQGRGDKYATGKQTTKKIRGRENITIGTRNVRTLNSTGKVKELTYGMTRHNWHVTGLCGVRWKYIRETITDESHKIYYSGKENKHEHGVGFLIHKKIVGSLLGCPPISSRIITLRLRTSPFNIFIVQVYAPTTNYDENKVKHSMVSCKMF